MSIDDSVLRDVRITMLAEQIGWSRRETLGCLLEIWAICYDRVDSALGERAIDFIARHPGFAKAMLDHELAAPSPSGKLRIAGAKERINYLLTLKQNGREGGLKSAGLRDKDSKGSTNPPVKGAHNPIVTVPDADPSPDIPPKGGKKTGLPVGWTPARNTATEAAESAAKARGVDLRLEMEKLLDWAKTNNAKKADWDATWRNWTRNAKPSSRTASQPVSVRPVVSDELPTQTGFATLGAKS